MTKTVRIEWGKKLKRLPLGYLWQEDGRGMFRIVFDPERAPAIRQVFRKVAEGEWTAHWAYLWLKYEADFFTRGSGSLSFWGVKRMLTTRFYCESAGNAHAPLVSVGTFRKAAAKVR